jgi:hypothetical protein
MRAELPSLAWTTPAGVASQLARYLLASGPAADLAAVPDPSPRVRAAELLARCATPAQRSSLRSLALDPREQVKVRRQALLALAKIGVGVSGPDFKRMLTALPQLRDEDSGCFETVDLLVLARSQRAVAAARSYLLWLTPTERAALTATPRDAMSPALSEWMYQHWLKVDRPALAGEQGPQSPNAGVIGMTRERVESRAVLQELWRKANGAKRRELLEILYDEESAWTFPGELTPGETTELAEALFLPVDALLAVWGRARLLSELGALLAADGRETEQKDRGRREHHPQDRHRYYRALRILRSWEDPLLDEWIAERALGARLHEDVRRELLLALWQRNRALAAGVGVALLATGEQAGPRVLLRWSAAEPQEVERTLFSAALGPDCSAELRYYGLCGLDRLGGAADQWLPAVSDWVRHPLSRMRIRTLGALARRGDLMAWDTLQVEAEGSGSVYERAEIVAMLGELDAAACQPLFQRLLAREERDPRGLSAPVAEEAALALARLATPETLTVLLNAGLTTSIHSLWAALSEYLEAIFQAEPGTTPVLRQPFINWRGYLPSSWYGWFG